MMKLKEEKGMRRMQHVGNIVDSETPIKAWHGIIIAFCGDEKFSLVQYH